MEYVIGMATALRKLLDAVEISHGREHRGRLEACSHPVCRAAIVAGSIGATSYKFRSVSGSPNEIKEAAREGL